MPLFRGNFFLMRAELSVSPIRAELWVPLEETCRIIGTILETCGSITKKSKGYAKVASF